MPRSHFPDRGDIVWLQCNPQTGNEQSGRRPAFVISPRAYHQKVGLTLFCPLTSNVNGYPFEVIIPTEKDISGTVLSDQIEGLDGREPGRSAADARAVKRHSSHVAAMRSRHESSRRP